MSEKNPRCPICSNKLYYRVKPDAFVCKNPDCVSFHKCGTGALFDEAGEYIKYQGLTLKDLSVFKNL